MSLKARIELIRKEKGLTIADLARKIGISRQALYQAFDREAEKGTHNIDLATAQRLAEFSGRSLQWVQTGEEEALAPAAPERRLELEPEAVALPVDDATVSDPGARYQALKELVEGDGFDPGAAWAAVEGVQFQHGRQVTAFDYYSVAKRALREQTRPHKKAAGSERVIQGRASKSGQHAQITFPPRPHPSKK
jgi:transcriptional regulator with XRE-family HTH domain